MILANRYVHLIFLIDSVLFFVTRVGAIQWQVCVVHNVARAARGQLYLQVVIALNNFDFKNMVMPYVFNCSSQISSVVQFKM